MASHLLFDLKVMDEARHESFTGVHNRWILENLSWVTSNGNGGRKPTVTVRIPLIPGINADEENLAAVVRFLAGLDVPPKVDLLPYHRMGVGKYDRIGLEYQLSQVTPPPKEVVFVF